MNWEKAEKIVAVNDICTLCQKRYMKTSSDTVDHLCKECRDKQYNYNPASYFQKELDICNSFKPPIPKPIYLEESKHTHPINNSSNTRKKRRARFSNSDDEDDGERDCIITAVKNSKRKHPDINSKDCEQYNSLCTYIKQEMMELSEILESCLSRIESLQLTIATSDETYAMFPPLWPFIANSQIHTNILEIQRKMRILKNQAETSKQFVHGMSEHL